MKNLTLIFALIATTSFGQVKTTTQNGAFWNPLTWDCFCLPADGDSLVIDHDIDLSTGIAYTMGQIYISASGSLSDGTNTLSFYINGGSLINNGSLSIDNLLLDAGFIENNGTATLDSVWTRSTTSNSGTMTTNAFAHDQNATFTNTGTITANDNFANQGLFENTGTFTIAGNASNCNIQSSDATIDNDGVICIDGTFLNCATDTLKGSGVFYIAGASTNNGEVMESLVIHTPSGGFSVNLGTVAGSVVFGTNTCGVSIEEGDVQDWTIYPNPAENMIMVSEKNVSYTIYDLSGRAVLNASTNNGMIEIESLESGNYIIHLQNTEGQSTTKPFIKL